MDVRKHFHHDLRPLMPETTSLQALIMAAGMATAGGIIFDTPTQNDAPSQQTNMSVTSPRVHLVHLVHLVQIGNRVTSLLSLA